MTSRHCHVSSASPSIKRVHDEVKMFDELVYEHHQQIENYRLIESQRLGTDIGWDWAAEEWISKHFPEWKQLQWDRMVAEALRTNYLRLAEN